MMHDLFIPCRINNYFLHKKRILIFEVTPVVIQSILVEFSGKKITVQDQQTIYLKESSEQIRINTIKKIISSVGAVDQIVSTLSTSPMIFKEIQIPFLDQETLRMVIPFEIENILPFALDQVTIDFIVTQQDFVKKTSKVLVAAVQKIHIEEQYEFFKEADISLDMITVDVFGLYSFYKNLLKERHLVLKSEEKKESIFSKALQAPKNLYHLIFKKKNESDEKSSAVKLEYFHPKRSEILVDIGYKTIKVLYIKDGVIATVRIIPLGLADDLEYFTQHGIHSYEEIVENSISSNSSLLLERFKNIFDELSKTFLYFQQQDGALYISPYKIYLTGFYSENHFFKEQAQAYFGSIITTISIKELLKKINMTVAAQIKITSEQINLYASSILWYENPENNLLYDISQKKEFKTVTLQLLIMILISIVSLAGIFWRSYDEVSRWQAGYISSRKQLLNTLQEQMNLDLRGEKKIPEIFKKAEEELKRERKLWFSFMKQNETSPLEYLQDLSMAIDRSSIGLELKTVHIDYQKVIMTGTVKNLDALDLFYEELQSLKTLKLVSRPRELSWTVELKSKIDQEGAA